MKKMTIALFTAATMGVTGTALAAEVSDPSVFGRIQYELTDSDDPAESFDGTLDSQHIGVSGSATGLAGGLDASYYARIGGDSSGTSVQYAYINLGNEFVTLQYGTNDDLFYQLGDVMLDVERSYSGAAAPRFNGADVDADSVNIRSDFGGSPVTLGAYANDREGNGINDVQLVASVEAGPATLTAGYNDTKEVGGSHGLDETLMFAASVDAGFATLAGRVFDEDNGNNPFLLAATVPLNASTNLYLMHGDDDNGANALSDSYAEVRTNLGAGLDIFVGGQSGDTEDKVFLGSRWAF